MSTSTIRSQTRSVMHRQIAEYFVPHSTNQRLVISVRRDARETRRYWAIVLFLSRVNYSTTLLQVLATLKHMKGNAIKNF